MSPKKSNVNDDELTIEDEYIGRKYRVVHCVGAKASLKQALISLTKSRRRSMQDRLAAFFKRFADGECLSRDSFPPEGDLPTSSGGVSNGKFYAFKKIPLRAYGWHSKSKPDVFYISHYIYKDFDDLSAADIDRVGKNWKALEER